MTIPKIRMLCVALLVCVTSGCSVRQVTRIATVATLQEMDATMPEAQRVLELGLATQAFVSDDGSIDTFLLRSALRAAVIDAFDAGRRAVVLLLVDEIVLAIVDQIDVGDLLPAEARVVIREAGEGVEQGAEFYIDVTFPP